MLAAPTMPVALMVLLLGVSWLIISQGARYALQMPVCVTSKGRIDVMAVGGVIVTLLVMFIIGHV